MSLEDRSPLSGLTRKLGRLARLEPDDVSCLLELPVDVARVSRATVIIREGSIPTRCCLLIKGFAARSKETATGLRQIVSFHIAGDLVDIQHLLLARADHTVETLGDAELAWIPKAQLFRLAWDRPNIGAALWRDSLIDASIFREWVLNVGRRDARARLAHMLCEFVARCEAAGLGDRQGFTLPMTQQQIADATGLTTVHVNRTLRALDADGVLTRNRNFFTVEDWNRLCLIADFDPAYLHAAAQVAGLVAS